MAVNVPQKSMKPQSIHLSNTRGMTALPSCQQAGARFASLSHRRLGRAVPVIGEAYASISKGTTLRFQKGPGMMERGQYLHLNEERFMADSRTAAANG
jgi:hypothetical protein